jgi:hypothetical protein
LKLTIQLKGNGVPAVDRTMGLKLEFKGDSLIVQ